MNDSADRLEDEAPDQVLNRRGFLKYALLGFSGVVAAAGVITPIIAYLWPPKQGSSASGDRVAVASTADLPPGTGTIFSVNNKPVIVINTAGEYIALDATCTHLGCILFWDAKREVIACPCHEALFSTSGAVISGPPPSPLASYRVQVEGDQIYVEGGEA